MMEFDLHMSDLDSNRSKIESELKTDDLVDSCNGINPKGKLEDVNSKINKYVTDITDSYDKYKSWVKDYVDKLDTTEGELLKFDSPELKGDFSNIFTKVLAPALKTGASDDDKKSLSELGELFTVINGFRVVDGNIVDVSRSLGKGEKYNLSDDDLAFLAYVALREQGSIEGAKLELSLMANLYERNKGSYSNVRDYVQRSGWFASNSMAGYSYPGDDYFKAAKDVLNDGNRYVANNVVEHDCLSDLVYCSTGDIYDTSSYIPGETVLQNRYGATYTFIGFAPNGGDPFGYK